MTLIWPSVNNFIHLTNTLILLETFHFTSVYHVVSLILRHLFILVCTLLYTSAYLVSPPLRHSPINIIFFVKPSGRQRCILQIAAHVPSRSHISFSIRNGVFVLSPVPFQWILLVLIVIHFESCF